jgi:hypothetical protein
MRLTFKHFAQAELDDQQSLVRSLISVLSQVGDRLVLSDDSALHTERIEQIGAPKTAIDGDTKGLKGRLLYRLHEINLMLENPFVTLMLDIER